MFVLYAWREPEDRVAIAESDDVMRRKENIAGWKPMANLL